MRNKKYALSLAGSLLAIALVAAVASALTPAHIYGNTFTGTQSGIQEFTVPNSTHTSTLFVRCNTASFTGKVHASPQASVTFMPSFTSCTTNIGGVRGATVTAPSAWELTPYDYSAANGKSDGNIAIPAADVVIRPVGLTCAVTIKAQTVSGGLGGQDVNAGGANSTHTTAAGVNLTASSSPAGYTSGCAGVAPNDTGTYSGVVKVVGAWAGP